MRDAEGEPARLIGITQNTTAGKAAAIALSESEERFRAMFEQATLGIVEINGDHYQKVNPGFCRIVGYSENELKRIKIRELTFPEDYAREQELTGQLIAGEIPDYTLEKRYRHKNGNAVWATKTVTLVTEPGGGRHILAIVATIGDRKRAEEELRQSEERFRLLVEGTPDYAMFLLDPENVITYWSSGAERVFGWTREEAVGKSGELIFTPEDRAKEQEEKEIATALRDGFAPDRRWHLRKDGHRIWVDGVMRRLDNPDGSLRGFAKIGRDATDQKTIEEALVHARDEMEQAVLDRTRDLLATNSELEQTMRQRQQLEKELLEISEREKRRIGEDLHDMVCQELTATALLLKSKAKKIERESKAAAEILEESAQTVNRNVGLTRDLARGLQPADLKGTGLKQALRALADQVCESSNITCHFKAARGVRVTDDTVALHLYRVAQEALKNAVKHSGAKNILIHLDHTETHVCVSVQDDGKGFSPKKRSKGLGLHIMRYRANALSGELKIEKRRNGGMDVTCKIPLKQ